MVGRKVCWEGCIGLPFCASIVAVDERGVGDPIVGRLIFQFRAALELLDSSLDLGVDCNLDSFFCFVHLWEGASYVLLYVSFGARRECTKCPYGDSTAVVYEVILLTS